MQQKAVLMLNLQDEKDKKKAMRIVSDFDGIDSISMNMKDGKLTVMGNFDPVHLVEKLRKLIPTHIESVGPAKDEKKGNDQAKANDPNKKGDDKNSAGGGKDQKGGGAAGDKVFPFPTIHYPPYPYQTYPPRPPPPMYYYDHPLSVEEDPNGCVIC